ncbi:MAG: hypothetical protein E7231_01580 [Cellulosilyticum sp.]|jgi:hypothetical protein|nr:hypothetical protein [Cellulosilyticum sp.]
MKCVGCPYSNEYYTSSECNEIEWECLAGHSYDDDVEDGAILDEDGELIGCTLSEEEAKAIVDKIEESIQDYYEGFCNYLEQSLE